VWLATSSPHEPAIPAPRHAAAFPGTIRAPRTPTFNEADVSQQPAWIQALPLLTTAQIAQIDAEYRKRLQSMLAVVEGVRDIITVLQETGDLTQTYIFFASDNGYHMGQHRLTSGKGNTIEEDIRVPLIIRGPGIPSGTVLPHMTVNIDLTATFAEIAGITIPEMVDGRSLMPLLNGAPPSLDAWRHSFLLERKINAAISGVRTERYSYTRLQDGTLQVYDLVDDPYEHVNIADSAPSTVLNQLEAQRVALRNCSGLSCRSTEDQPIP
jgi:arylsulfatase A-like enzyme